MKFEQKQRSCFVSLALCCISCLFLNFSTKDPSGPEAKPRINFVGELVSATGEVSSVENITIAGIYRQIPMYAIPADPDIDPVIDTTFVDLDEVSQIRSPFAPAQAGQVPGAVQTGSVEKRQSKMFKKRAYNEIIVVTNNDQKTERHYLVESTRKLMCDVLEGSRRLEREVSFLAINMLTIKSYKKREDPEVDRLKKQELSAAHQAMCHQAHATLKELESKPQDKETAEKLDKVREAVDNLCRP